MIVMLDLDGILVPRPWNMKREYSEVAPVVVEAELDILRESLE